MTSPLQTPVTTASSTLYFGPWYRRSPFFEKTLEAGCSAYDIYNHMYLPGLLRGPGRRVLGVAQRRDRLGRGGRTDRGESPAPTPRRSRTCSPAETSRSAPSARASTCSSPRRTAASSTTRCSSASRADRWWLALADSDAGLWARGVATHAGMDVKVREPDVYPMQVQGPKSKDVMRTLFGAAIDDIKYYWTLTTEVDGIPVVISRTGWTGEVGYGVPTSATRRVVATCGTASWRLASRTRCSIAPCEGASHRSGHLQLRLRHHDQRLAVPRHGPRATRRDAGRRLHRQGGARGICARGVDRKLVGIEADGDAYPFELSRKCDALHDGQPVGTVTDLIWSPRLKKNIGYGAAPDRPRRARYPTRRSSRPMAASGRREARRSHSSIPRRPSRSADASVPGLGRAPDRRFHS